MRCPSDGTALVVFDRQDPLIGRVVADRYEIERPIGEGAMGRVYRARHITMSRPFAIKVPFGDHVADPKMRERFSREAEAASRLSHPNVISVVDYGETETGLLYLVMDYVEGRELSRLVSEVGPLPAPRIHRLFEQLCLGLGHAHDRGLVHRDFKGQNVIVTGKGLDERARILDFGIAVVLEDSDKRLTTAGIVMGTPAYMSPEQATAEPLDHRSDLFSLGVVLYEMLAGVLPFTGTPIEIVKQNVACEVPRIRERVPGLEVDDRLEALAYKLMAKDPAARFQSARETVEALHTSHGADALRTWSMGSSAVLTTSATEPAIPSQRRASSRPGGPSGPDADALAATEAVSATHMQARTRRRTWLVAACVVFLVLAGALGVAAVWRDRTASLAGVADGQPAPAHATPAADPAASDTPAGAQPAGSDDEPDRASADDKPRDSTDKDPAGDAEAAGEDLAASDSSAKRTTSRSGSRRKSNVDRDRATDPADDVASRPERPEQTGQTGSDQPDETASRDTPGDPDARPVPAKKDVDRVSRLYEEVGGLLGELARIDASGARPLTSDYLRIDIQKAARDVGVLRDTRGTLLDLKTKIRDALQARGQGK